MKLSIIVPVYNMASDDRIFFCMDSLIGQTLADEYYEIIAVDDCSTDESLRVLRTYEKEHPGLVKVLTTPRNMHQGGAKNIGIDAAKGEWIGFVDADDWLAPEAYERMLRKAEQTGADMVGCDYCMVEEHTFLPGEGAHNNDASQTGVLDEEKYRSLIMDAGSLVVKIYRREIIVDCPSRFPIDIFYEDNALAATWMLRAKHFEYIDEPLYFYYQHNNSTVHTVTMQRLSDRMQAGRIMIAEARKGGFYEKYRDEIEYSFARLFYMNTLMSYMIGIRPRRYAWIKALGDETRDYFPDFKDNRYFKARVHPEELKWTALQQRSTLLFMFVYRLKELYRSIRY